MSELIVLVYLAILVIWMIREDRRIQRDPFRIKDTFSMSASCDDAKHEMCGYPGPLFFARKGVNKCQCRCHGR